MEVVVAQVGSQVPSQGRVFGHQRHREGRPPALLQDGSLNPLNSAIGLWSPGSDEALLDAECGDRLPEVEGTELGAVVGGDGLELPAGRRELLGDSPGEGGGELSAGVEVGAVNLGPDEGAGNVDGGVLPDPALGAAQAADVEAVELDQIARLFSFEVAIDGWRGRSGWGGAA